MKISRCLFVGAALSLVVGFGAMAKINLIEKYFTGSLSGIHAVKADVDLSSFQYVAGFQGDDKLVQALSAKQGKILFVTFWERHCLKCRGYLKKLDKLQAEFGDAKFEVVAINVGRQGYAYADKTLKQWGVEHLGTYSHHHYAILNELNANHAFNLHGKEPKTLIIGAEGKVLAYTNVKRNWLSDEGRAMISALKTDQF